VPSALKWIAPLVYAYLQLGELERAGQAADARLTAAPNDAAWKEKRLSILGQIPSRRPEAILGLQQLVEQKPQDLESRTKLAQLLSWTPGRLDDAVKEYRAAVAIAPNNYLARRGLAQVLSWNNASAEAVTVYDALLAENPNDIDVLLGRAQVARWTGDRATASRLLARGLAASPKDASLLAEQSRLDLDSGRRTAAAQKANEALALSPALDAAKEAQAAVLAATATRAQVKMAYSDDSSGFRSSVINTSVELYPRPDTRVRIEPGYAEYRDNIDRIKRPNLGIGVRQGLPAGFTANALFRAYFPDNVKATHETQGELVWQPFELPFAVTGGMRRRAIVDSPLGYEDVAHFGRIGSGGTTVAGIRQRLQITERVLGFTANPITGMYVYGEATRGTQSDDNRRRSVAAGLGLDVFRYADILPKHSLTLKYDIYRLSFDRVSEIYFSPNRRSWPRGCP